jgi:hypothetical protein
MLVEVDLYGWWWMDFNGGRVRPKNLEQRKYAERDCLDLVKAIER